MKSLLAALSFAALATVMPAQTTTCPAGRTQLMILGTFHMAGSTQDMVNTRSDMSSETRQQELAVLVDQLAGFAPSKIAIESARTSTVWNERYAQWKSGTYTMGMNEVEQIGFRLARKLQLPELTPVDYPMWMNGLTPIERHTPRPAPQPAVKAPVAPPAAPADPSEIESVVRAQIARDEKRLAESTISQYLVYLNTPERSSANHQWDVISNIVPGDGVALYENTDLAVNWYQRNLRIITNILDVATPEDRVLLIIGAGHKKILTDFVSIHPRFCVVEPSRFLH